LAKILIFLLQITKKGCDVYFLIVEIDKRDVLGFELKIFAKFVQF